MPKRSWAFRDRTSQRLQLRAPNSVLGIRAGLGMLRNRVGCLRSVSCLLNGKYFVAHNCFRAIESFALELVERVFSSGVFVQRFHFDGSF